MREGLSLAHEYLCRQLINIDQPWGCCQYKDRWKYYWNEFSNKGCRLLLRSSCTHVN